MAETVAAVQIQVDGSQAISSMSQMRQQIAAANDKLIQMVTTYGEASAEAAAAAGQVAALRDQLDAANQLTQAMNPDAPFAALGGAVQGVIGGFTAAQGAMAAFGFESKAAEDIIVGLEGAMALQSGVQGIMNSVESFKMLGAVLKQNTIIQRIMNFVTQGQFVTTAQLTGATAAQATAETANAAATEAAAVATGEAAVASGAATAATTAQTAATVGTTTAMTGARMAAIALRGALMLIGIGALVIGIVALIKVIQDWTDESKEQEEQIAINKKAYEDLNSTLEDQGNQFDKNQKHQLAMAKASGMSAEAIRKLEIKLADEKIAYEQSALAIAKQTAEKARNYLQTLKNADADEEQLNKQQAVVDDFTKLETEKTKAVKDATEARADIIRQHEVDIKQDETDAANRRRENAKKERDEAKQKAARDRADAKKQRDERQKEIDNATKQSEENTRKLEEENFLQSIKDEDKRAKVKLQIDYENARKQLAQSKANKEAREKELAALDEKFRLENEALETSAREKKQKMLEDEAQKSLDAMIQQLQKEADEQEKARQLQIERDKAEIETRTDLRNAYFDATGAAINILKDFAGKNKNLQRAALIAENALTIARIVLDTQKANAAVGAKYALLPGGGILAAREIITNKIKAGIGIATAIAATAKGLQGIGGSGGGSTGGANSLGGGGGGTAAPIPVEGTTTTLNPNQINQLANASNRAFVVESDVSGNQERIRRLNRAARIN